MSFVRVGPNSIHSDEAIKFVERLNPDPFVLDVMKNGLKLDFHTVPSRYYEPNNKSCIENPEVTQEKVASWVESS